MAWVYLLGLALVLWGACGATMAMGRKALSLNTTLRVHLAVAPIVAFLVSAVHKLLAPEFDPMLRAAVMTSVVVILDAAVVAPLFERSYAMFRSSIGTWIPFASIFLSSWTAGILA
jgi:hypothetical protein